MNIHILIDDKFIDSFIGDVEVLDSSGENVFWIRAKQSDLKHVKKIDKLIFLEDVYALESRLSTLSEKDKIFVHWYDQAIASLLFKLPNIIIVFLWGGEMYGIPLDYHTNWLYDRQTLQYVKQANIPKISLSSSLKPFLRSLLNYFRYFFGAPHSDISYEDRLRQIHRIDVLVAIEQNTSEIALIRKLYPGSNFISLPGFYDQNFDISVKMKSKIVEGRIKILLGNSATEPNNHLDAFSLLKGIDADIYCPLSYGRENYKNFILREGMKYFGDSFFPITSFLDRAGYVGLLNEMDIVFMYHNRSQAWGNIATSIALGKPVFLKKKNPIWGMITNMGLNCYDAERIWLYDLEELIKHEYRQRNESLERLRWYISKEKRLLDLSRVLNFSDFKML